MQPLDDTHEKLEKLLGWKRHEKPPPGYFNRLSSQIMTRIEAEEQAANESWWQWLAGTFAKPAAACAYGMGLGALLVLGVGFTQQIEEHEIDAAIPPLPPRPWQTAETHNERIPSATSFAQHAYSSFNRITAAESSIHPVIESGPPSFLLNSGGLKVELANFSFR